MRVAALILTIAVFSASLSRAQHADTAIPVNVQQDGNGWKLFRDGKPYFVKGAGGLGCLKLLRQSGGNSNRTWGVGETTISRLDEAHANGISVTVGIWLEHATRGYDYQDYEQVNEQIDRVLSAVRKYKDHPAVLIWGIGNEMEGYKAGDNPAIWHHVEHLCRRIKNIDPNHPTMTVVAEIGGNRIAAINRFCPSVDIVGINSYGGAASLPERYRKAGGRKPYIVTEFGPSGPWESQRDDLNAVIEPFSHVKAQKYRDSYLGFTADTKFCLGSYSFLWGQKMEATATWFGMLLEDGRPTAIVDTMTELWTGSPPSNLAPVIESLENQTGCEVDPGETLHFELVVSDFKPDAQTIEWRLLPEADAYITYGEFKPNPQPIANAVIQVSDLKVTVTAPCKAGLYRLYAFVNNGHGAVATSNVVFKVKPTPLKSMGIIKELPCLVFDEPDQERDFPLIAGLDGSEEPNIDTKCLDNPKFGKHCIRWSSAAEDIATGIAFSDEHGIDLTGARRISFWAKGAAGDETIRVGIGRSEDGSLESDTFAKEKTILLTRYWKNYHIDFATADLRRIRTGFWWSSLPGNGPVALFLDKIEFE